MARARKSEAGTILGFFRRAPMETAQTVFDLVREEMKARQPQIRPTPVAKKQKKVEPTTAASEATTAAS